MHLVQLRSFLYIIKRFWFQIFFWQAHFSVSLKRSMMNGNGLHKHYKMDFWIKFRCAWHKNFVQKYLSEKNAAHIKNAAESLWDTKSKLMRRHALFPSIISHTSFVSLHNCPTLWPFFFWPYFLELQYFIASETNTGLNLASRWVWNLNVKCMFLASAFQCIIKTLDDEWEMGMYKHYKMYFWIKFRCAWH